VHRAETKISEKGKFGVEARGFDNDLEKAVRKSGGYTGEGNEAAGIERLIYTHPGQNWKTAGDQGRVLRKCLIAEARG